MATVQFQDVSPFKQDKKAHNSTDFLYSRFLKTLNLTNDAAKEEKQINIAIFGLGRAGTIHIGNAVNNSEIFISYLVDEDLSRANSTKRDFFLHETTVLTPKEAAQVFDDPSVDGVIIATPTETHKSYIIPALKAGKHVMCEKPISHNTKEIKECYAMAEKSSGSLFCAMVRRFDPAISEIQKQVRLGQVGQVHMIKTTARDSPLPEIKFLKTSGGIFHDCAIHDVDMICWILGEFPSKVSVLASCFIPEIKEMDDFDTVQITMKYPSGTIATIDLSRNAVYGYDQRFEAFGPKGKIAINRAQPFNLETSLSNGDFTTPICSSFPSRYFEGFRIELEHFINVIKGADVSVTAEEALNVATICSALEKSARTETMVEVNY